MPQERGWLAWQLAALLAGTMLVLGPLLAPCVDLFEQPGAWTVWSEGNRLLPLLRNTLLVMLGSILVALALGGSAAFLLVCTNVPGRRGWFILLALGLFIPLPLFTCGWYLVAQFTNQPFVAAWPEWQRLMGAAWLHGVVGVPWAALIIGLGLLWIEPELEETARLEGSPVAVLRHVMWPRCWPFVSLAALVVAWTTWHEITVTDFFKVNTLAEEVYLQLNSGREAEARATAAALPWCLLFALLCSRSLRVWRAHCPPRWPSVQDRRSLAWGKWRWPAVAWLFVVVLCVLVIPVAGLVAKAGMEYAPDQPPSWSWFVLGQTLVAKAVEARWMLMHSLVVGLVTGLCTAGTVLFLLWLTRRSQCSEGLVWGVCALLWAVPAPLLGLGLLTLIQVLIQLPGGQIWSPWLYSAPSPVPNIWSAWLRYLPLAWAAAWPFARLIPKEWEELTLLDGAGPWRRMRVVYWPALARPLLGLTLAVGILSLGEISASKLVTTPGYTPLSHHIFQQLHAGMDSDVAALSLVLLIPALLGGILLVLCPSIRSSNPSAETAVPG